MAMTFFSPEVVDDYEWINCCNPDDHFLFDHDRLDGSCGSGDWHPVLVRRVRADERSGFKRSDFPWLRCDLLVMRRSAVDALEDILEANGKVLPLATEDGVELFVFNARSIDALDEDRSSVIRFSGSNRIMLIEEVAFNALAIGDADAFRLPCVEGLLYLSQRFVDRVRSAGLVGIGFKRVWSSE